MDVLLVDGYNIIGAWDELKRLRDEDLDQARNLLVEKMAEYGSYRKRRVIVVFDAYEVKGIENKQKHFNVEIIFTKEQETADECIERLIKELKNVKTKVFVATSDFAEQRTIFGQGAYRISARELAIEVQNIEHEIEQDIKFHQHQTVRSTIPLEEDIRKLFEDWRRGKK
ncbi:hypothetical protein GGQ92_001674 [Gracilibacillus halotolerans]|uniref:NYN domain-containing protein n=1 Tax=Gracilibacillus halotolerans TaxID=74386 RepID=A0A841RNY4_9BACI|nr:NYN domain-containing protein [Gracilibacillus halotolerans]MBB6512885.1 hypothetical protein [Gracilibacillus halotolerans]